MLIGQQHIQGISGTVQFPFTNPVKIEQVLFRLKTFRESQPGRLLVFNCTTAVRNELSSRIMDRNRQTTPQNAFRGVSSPKGVAGVL